MAMIDIRWPISERALNVDAMDIYLQEGLE
jgi:hypothetical protein